MKVYPLNCVKIESPAGSAIGHCNLIENNDSLTLIDAGIGLAESKDPEKTLGKELIEETGFQLDENLSAIRQIEQLGLNPSRVSNIICSHLDPDHIGGAQDFPQAKLHLAVEEYQSFNRGQDRYLSRQLAHKPELQLYENNDREWFGLGARQLNVGFEAYLIPLFGHTEGHCGIAFKSHDLWSFYVGDAYYLRAELDNKNHPVDQLASLRAVDNESRLASLEKVRELIKNYGEQIDYFGYHDPREFKGN